MKTRIFALVIGIAFLLAGLLGFVPALRNIGGHVMPPLAVNATTGFLLGLFPVNVLHNIVHLLVGVLGIGAYSSYGAARGFSRGLAIFYLLLAIMGLIPVLNTTFGLIPIFGADIWLHALTALLAAYFGFLAPREDADNDFVMTRNA